MKTIKTINLKLIYSALLKSFVLIVDSNYVDAIEFLLKLIKLFKVGKIMIFDFIYIFIKLLINFIIFI